MTLGDMWSAYIRGEFAMPVENPNPAVFKTWTYEAPLVRLRAAVESWFRNQLAVASANTGNAIDNAAAEARRLADEFIEKQRQVSFGGTGGEPTREELQASGGQATVPTAHKTGDLTISVTNWQAATEAEKDDFFRAAFGAKRGAVVDFRDNGSDGKTLRFTNRRPTESGPAPGTNTQTQQLGPQGGLIMDALKRELQYLISTGSSDAELTRVIESWKEKNRNVPAPSTADLIAAVRMDNERVRRGSKELKTPEELRREAFEPSEAGRQSLFSRFIRGFDKDYDLGSPAVRETYASRFPALQETFRLDPEIHAGVGAGPTMSFEDFLGSGRAAWAPGKIAGSIADLSARRTPNIEEGSFQSALRSLFSGPQGDELAFTGSVEPYLANVSPMLREAVAKMARRRFDRERVERAGTPFYDLLADAGGSYVNF